MELGRAGVLRDDISDHFYQYSTTMTIHGYLCQCSTARDVGNWSVVLLDHAKTFHGRRLV